MGETIFYKGTLRSIEDREALIERSKRFFEENGWPYEEIEDSKRSGVRAQPHPKSESLNLLFDGKLRMDTFTKTAFAPEEVHGKIVELLYAIKPHFKRLNVLDEAEVWDEYVERMNPVKKKPFVYKEVELTEVQRREAEAYEFRFEPRSDWKTIDLEFWGMTEGWGEIVLLSLPAIRDKMRADLSEGHAHPLTVRELKLIHESRENRYFEDRPGAPEITIMSLATMWAERFTIVKGARSASGKNLRISIFAWVLAYMFFGFGGTLDRKWHKGALLFAEEFLERHGDSDTPYRSMVFFYSLLDVLNMELKTEDEREDG